MNIIKENKIFRRLFSSIFLSALGDKIFYFAVISMVLFTSNPSVAIVLLTISETLPDILAIFFGKLASQTKNKINMMVISDMLRAVIFVIIGIILTKTINNYIFLFIVVMNFISDCLGKYYNSLGLVVLTNSTTNKERHQAISIEQGGLQLISIVGIFFGGVLASVITSYYLSLINAGTFILAGIFIWSIRKTYMINQTKVESEIQEKVSIKKSLKLLKNHKYTLVISLFYVLIISIIGGLSPVIEIMYISRLNELPFSLSMAISISFTLLGSSMLVGNIVSNIKTVKNSSMKFDILLLCSILLIMVIVSSYYFSYIVFNISFTILGCFLGIFSPKFYTNVINKFKESDVPIIMGAVGSLNGIIAPMVSLSLAFVAGTAGYIYSFWIIGVLSIIALGCIILIKID